MPKTPKKRKRVYRVEMELVEDECGEGWYSRQHFKDLVKDSLDFIDYIVVKNLKIRRVKSWE